MKQRPFFSIVIPTYNRASDLEFALFCILSQTFKNFEIVISDNCSTDDTAKIVETFRDKRIRYTKTDKTLWNSHNIAGAINKAKGQYIFIHSDDDFLLYNTSLETIYQEIINYSCGYLRLNYLSMSFNKKNIFAYRVNKPFVINTYVPKFLDNNAILGFIRDSDPYFMSGIILKNLFPKHITIVDTDPAPWIDMLFYNTYKFGACFIVKPQIIAQWSRRKIPKNQVHHIFSLINGKLRSEGYLNAIKSKVGKLEYRKFLCKELYLLYVESFPMVKAKVGNYGLLKLSERITTIAPELKKKISYRFLLLLALYFPETFWIIARTVYLWIYARVSRPYNYSELVIMLKQLEREFISSRNQAKRQVSRVFNF